MPDIMIALVTGANKGIGQQIAAQLANLGHTVLIGARDPDAGKAAAQELQGAAGQVSSVVLDVTDPASAAAAAEVVQQRFGRLELVNNAGISGRPGADFAGQMPATANVDDIRYIFETNVFGVITVTAAFLPLLRRSAAPRIVNVSSSAGSLALTADFDNQNPIALGYVPSKTALTSLTIQYARGLAAEKIPGQRGVSRLRSDRSQWFPRCAQPRAGRDPSCRDGDHPRRRTDRHLHRRPGPRALVGPQGSRPAPSPK